MKTAMTLNEFIFNQPAFSQKFMMKGKTYRFIGITQDFHEEIVRQVSTGKEMKTVVATTIVVAENINRGKIVAFSEEEYGDTKITVL